MKFIKAASKKEGSKKFGGPEKRAVFFHIKGLLFSRVPQIFLALLILKRLYWRAYHIVVNSYLTVSKDLLLNCNRLRS